VIEAHATTDEGVERRFRRQDVEEDVFVEQLLARHFFNAFGAATETAEVSTGVHADVIVLRTDSLAMTPLNNPIAAVVYNAHGGMVDSILVAGQFVKRGGVLTHGSFLVSTSNPNRTSPVKRGLFVLENLLATKVPPPPANVPPLDEAKADVNPRAVKGLRVSRVPSGRNC